MTEPIPAPPLRYFAPCDEHEVCTGHIVVAPPALDVKRLAEAARMAGRKMNVPLLANPITWRDFADEVAAEYARLEPDA